MSNRDLIDAINEDSRTMTLAHRAATEIAGCNTQLEFKHVLQTFEIEPLDCLHALIGSYLEDRSRTLRVIPDEPF